MGHAVQRHPSGTGHEGSGLMMERVWSNGLWNGHPQSAGGANDRAGLSLHVAPPVALSSKTTEQSCPKNNFALFGACLGHQGNKVFLALKISHLQPF